MKCLKNISLSVLFISFFASAGWAVDLKYAGSTAIQLGFMFDAAKVYIVL